MSVRKVRGGEWAVYRTSAGNYASVWEHFTKEFYGAERRGYDEGRAFYETYTEDGAFMEVYIPVDAELSRESGQTRTVHELPDMMLVGYGGYAEADHPQYGERPFEKWNEVARLFPRAEYVARVSVHSLFGKPLMGFDGVSYNELMDVPDGMERFALKGGYERKIGFKHFTGDYQAWGEALDMPVESPLLLFTLDHPRGFNQYVYNARGGYSEIGVPMRIVGERHYDVVELEAQRIIGKLEAPPDCVVTEEDIERFYHLPENAQPGSYWIGFTLAERQTQANTGSAFYDKPLIKGVKAMTGARSPEDFCELTLPGGVYVRITEDRPNGVLGWEGGEITLAALAAAGRPHDESRPYLYHQRENGRRYALYIPIA